MGHDYGKAFEQSFRENWKQCFKNTFIYRLPDQMSEYKGSTNPCDFICFVDKKLFLIETKVHKGNTLPWSAFPQYERLLDFKDYKDVYPGVVIWFKDHDILVWYGINDLETMHINNKKSIRFDDENLYNGLVIPARKKRIFLEGDYKALLEHLNDKQ